MFQKNPKIFVVFKVIGHQELRSLRTTKDDVKNTSCIFNIYCYMNFLKN